MDTSSKKEQGKGVLSVQNMVMVGVIVLSITLSLIFKVQGKRNAEELIELAKDMLLVVPAILVIIGLISVWVSSEFIQKHLGTGSGVKGMVSAFGFPLFVPIPIFMAFPMGNDLFNKKARLAYVYIFFEAMAFSIITLLFEAQFLGVTWMGTRLAVSVPIVIGISFFNEWLYFKLKFGTPIPAIISE